MVTGGQAGMRGAELERWLKLGLLLPSSPAAVGLPQCNHLTEHCIGGVEPIMVELNRPRRKTGAFCGTCCGSLD